jgi:hypothetical protein
MDGTEEMVAALKRPHPPAGLETSKHRPRSCSLRLKSYRNLTGSLLSLVPVYCLSHSLTGVSFRANARNLALLIGSSDLSGSLPAGGFILSHSTLLMALSEVEGPVEGIEMKSDGRDTTLAFRQDKNLYFSLQTLLEL